jgi:hypothetical protein
LWLIEPVLFAILASAEPCSPTDVLAAAFDSPATSLVDSDRPPSVCCRDDDADSWSVERSILQECKNGFWVHPVITVSVSGLFPSPSTMGGKAANDRRARTSLAFVSKWKGYRHLLEDRFCP